MIPQDNERKIGRYTFSTFSNKHWIKLLFHNTTGKVEFENEEEALNYYNPNNKQLYSIIGKVNNGSKINNEFEFIIEYPNERKYYQWKQKNFPLYEPDEIGKTSIEGFTLLYPESSPFKGLAYSLYIPKRGCKPSLFDGDLGSTDFNYCVGMMKCGTAWDHATIPGIDGSTYAMSFWMRIININFYTNIRRRERIKIVCFVLIFSHLS